MGLIKGKTVTISSDVEIKAVGNKGRATKRHRKHRQNHNMVDGDPEKQGVVEYNDKTEDTKDEKKSKKRNTTRIKVKEVSPGVTIPANDTEDNQKLQVESKSNIPVRGLNKDNAFVDHLNAITSMGDVIDSMFKKIKKGSFTNKNHKKIVTILTRIKSDCGKLETLF